MNKITIQNFQTPAGELVLGSVHGKICLCDWRHRESREVIYKKIMEGLDAYFEEGESGIIKTTKEQLSAYFKKDRKSFDISLHMVGTLFQQSVWNELLKIPYGKTLTYFQIARQLKNEHAVRAVASANGANPLAIIVPCHRVVGSKGELTGYSGGIETKKKLLHLETGKEFPKQLDLFE